MREESVTPNHPWYADPTPPPDPQTDEGTKGDRADDDKVKPKKG